LSIKEAAEKVFNPFADELQFQLS